MTLIPHPHYASHVGQRLKRNLPCLSTMSRAAWSIINFLAGFAQSTANGFLSGLGVVKNCASANMKK